MVSFALGVSSIILLLAMASREALFRNRDRLARLSRYAKPITGILLVLLGLFLFFELNHVVDRWAIQTLPHWLLDLSVRF
jgi:threonine/homoserine/homoserine lactone efflux protein